MTTIETKPQSDEGDVRSNRSLRDLLRRELAAAAMYEKATQRVKGEERIALEQNRWSHVVRAVALGQLIREHGDAPPSTAGAWSLAATLVGSSAALSQKLALRAVHEAEHLISDSLESGLSHLSTGDRMRIESDILPQQRESEERARRIMAHD
jgi:demethoxyubiquinone hydroxylase (CLK1/Coq7/Cat5 family)